MGSLSDTVPIKKRKFDVDEYHRLGEVGILKEDDGVELIGGRSSNSRFLFPRLT
jgi:hypothetical protein